jgi:hypothetical protein
LLHEAGLVMLGLDLPELLETDAVFLGLAALGQVEALDELLGKRAAHALPDQHILAHEGHAGLVVRAARSVALDAHVARDDARHRTVFAIDQIGCGKARIDLNAQRFGMAGQPAADIAERDDVIAVIAHQRRHEHVGHAQRACRPQHQELVVGHLGLEGMIGLGAPLRQQTVDADGIDYGARQDMRPHLGTLFENHDGQFRVDLLEPNGSGKPGRTGADDHHVELHAFALDFLAHCKSPVIAVASVSLCLRAERKASARENAAGSGHLS